jgi:hypothetical protein
MGGKQMEDTIHSAVRSNHGRTPPQLCGKPSRVLCQAKLTATFEQLQQRLTQTRLESIGDTMPATQLEWVAKEASSLSWMSGFPLLFFPLLFEEKTALALDQHRRQKAIHARSRELLGRGPDPGKRLS